MRKAVDAKQAFPAHANRVPTVSAEGATEIGLRDWFAGHALAGMVSLTIEAGHVRSEEEVEALIADAIEQRAMVAYRYADAMLKARSE